MCFIYLPLPQFPNKPNTQDGKIHHAVCPSSVILWETQPMHPFKRLTSAALLFRPCLMNVRSAILNLYFHLFCCDSGFVNSGWHQLKNQHCLMHVSASVAERPLVGSSQKKTWQQRLCRWVNYMESLSVHIKIAGKWMSIPPRNGVVFIGFDP